MTEEPPRDHHESLRLYAATLARYPLDETGRWRLLSSPDGWGGIITFRICNACGHWERRVHVPDCSCTKCNHHPPVRSFKPTPKPTPKPTRAPGLDLVDEIMKEEYRQQRSRKGHRAVPTDAEPEPSPEGSPEDLGTGSVGPSASSGFTYSKEEGWA